MLRKFYYKLYCILLILPSIKYIMKHITCSSYLKVRGQEVAESIQHPQQLHCTTYSVLDTICQAQKRLYSGDLNQTHGKVES